MQNNAALMILVLAMSSILIFNSGCNGATPTQSTFGSIAVPTTAKCGSLNISGEVTVVSNNTCYSGTLEDIADSTTNFLWNCLGANGGQSASCELALPPPSVLPGTSNGIMDDSTYFYVGLDTTDGGIAHVHSTAGFATPCAINKASVANEDITCIMEIPEGDLYGKNTKMLFNIPPGDMCRFTVRAPYWFYNHEVGQAPSSINVSVDNTVNASGDITASTYSCTFDGGAADPGCDNNPELVPTLAPFEQSFSCNYDKTAEDGPNCCFGKFTRITTISTNGANPQTSTVKGLWGGSYNTCIGGPGKTNWSLKSKEGIPAWMLEFTQTTGNKGTQEITAGANLADGAGISASTASIHAANYYGDAANHTHTGFVISTDITTAPYFINPIDDRSGTRIAPTQNSYEFRCLDAAFEIKHRIRVFIREWDTLPDYQTYISSAGATVVPDRGADLEPGVNCSAIAAIGEGCNDKYDIDDFLKLILPLPEPDGAGLSVASYDTTTKSLRKHYFPKIKYGGN